MTVKIILSKALDKHYKKYFSANTVEFYNKFYEEEGLKLGEYIKNNISEPYKNYNVILLSIGYTPWELLSEASYTNLKIDVTLFEDETNLAIYEKLVEHYTKKEKTVIDDIDDYFVYSDRMSYNSVKIYSFYVMPMFNNCGTLVSTHASKHYSQVKRISGPMLEFKKNIARYYRFSNLMITAADGKYSNILKLLGMKEVHRFKNNRSSHEVLTLVTPIEKKDDK